MTFISAGRAEMAWLLRGVAPNLTFSAGAALRFRHRRTRAAGGGGRCHIDLAEGRAWKLIQLRAVRLLDQLLAHAAGPEFIDVIGDAIDGIAALGLSLEEMADVIGHRNQMRFGFFAHGPTSTIRPRRAADSPASR